MLRGDGLLLLDAWGGQQNDVCFEGKNVTFLCQFFVKFTKFLIFQALKNWNLASKSRALLFRLVQLRRRNLWTYFITGSGST
jgi:hypothetical protein